MLILFPLISWMYLQSGLDFRKKVLAELGDFGTIPVFEIEIDGEHIASTTYCANKLSLIYLSDLAPGKGDQNVEFDLFYEPFDDRKDMVAIYLLKEDIESLTTYAEDEITYAQYSCDEFTELCDVLENLADGNGMSLPLIFLLDGALEIRNVYQPGNELEQKALMEHIAILIPSLKK